MLKKTLRTLKQIKLKPRSSSLLVTNYTNQRLILMKNINSNDNINMIIIRRHTDPPQSQHSFLSGDPVERVEDTRVPSTFSWWQSTLTETCCYLH